MARPVVEKIHKVSGTIPNGSTAVDLLLDSVVDRDKTWVILHSRTPDSNESAESMVGFLFVNSAVLRVLRSGAQNIGDIHVEAQLIEFSQGVKVQRGVFSDDDWNDEEISIDPVDLTKAFLTLKVTSFKTANSGFDIVGEMWVRGKFKDASTILLDHNDNTIGDSPERVDVYWQVVEFEEAARVWSKDVTGMNLAAPSAGNDIIADLDRERPPSPEQTFMIYSQRIQASASGTSPRVDFWSSNGFLYNGTAGFFRTGGDVGETKDAHFFIVELEFATIESHHIKNEPGSAGVPQTIDTSLQGVRDAANTVALIPWCQWGGFVDEGGSTSSKFWTTVSVVDEDTLRFQRDNAGSNFISLDAYVIEFEEPALQPSLGPMKYKRMFTDVVEWEEGQFGTKAFQQDITLPDFVDPDRCILWATAFGTRNIANSMVWTDFVDNQTIHLETVDTDEEITSIRWFLLEFEQGINVQRGNFRPADYSQRHAEAILDPVDVGKSLVVQQWGLNSPRGVAWLDGSERLRSYAHGSGGTTMGWQVVTLGEGSAVDHFGLSWLNGGVEEKIVGRPPSPINKVFPWALDFLSDDDRMPVFDVIADGVIVSRYDNDGLGATVLDVATFGTFEGKVPVQEHQLVTINFSSTGLFQIDVDLDNTYDVDNTVAWVPLSGYYIAAKIGDRDQYGAHKLEILDPDTLRMHVQYAGDAQSGDVWEGFVYILGFFDEEPGNGESVTPGSGDGDCWTDCDKPTVGGWSECDTPECP